MSSIYIVAIALAALSLLWAAASGARRRSALLDESSAALEERVAKCERVIGALLKDAGFEPVRATPARYVRKEDDAAVVFP